MNKTFTEKVHQQRDHDNDSHQEDPLDDDPTVIPCYTNIVKVGSMQDWIDPITVP